MQKPIAVVGLLFHEEALLVVSRRGNQYDLGLPGGKLETDETPFDALVREVQEETGVKVLRAEHVLTRVDSVSKCLVWTYMITQWQGDPTTLEPGVFVSWVHPKRLLGEACSFREYNLNLFRFLLESPWAPTLTDQLWAASLKNY